jgi:hypothetical protein
MLRDFGERVDLTEDDRARVRELARDLPAVWERKNSKARSLGPTFPPYALPQATIVPRMAKSSVREGR